MSDDFEKAVEGIPAGGNRRSAKDLPDGEFNLVIKSAVLKDPFPQGGIVFATVLEVVEDGPVKGLKFQHDYWLKNNAKEGKPSEVSDIAVGQLRSDLKALGMDEAEWKAENGRKFSDELKKASILMKDMVIKIKKTTNGNFANVKVLGRGEGDKKPNPVGAAELDAAVAAAKEEIPF